VSPQVGNVKNNEPEPDRADPALASLLVPSYKDKKAAASVGESLGTAML
jgi:hypothetical protein